MATSSIKLYRTHITPSRNALVDDIEDYLGSLTGTYEDTTFQYLKLGLDLTIVINAAQSTIPNHSLGNYCRIVQDGKIWYYFILNCNWKSQNAVELKLSIDSINTFRNDLTWSRKTTIAREHRNRFRNYGDYAEGSAVRYVDKQPENISALKVKYAESTAQQSNLAYDWYLMYRTSEEITAENPNSAVNCYLFASQPLTLSAASSATQTFTYSDFVDGYYYFFTDIDNPGGSFGITTGGTTTQYSFGSSEGLNMLVLHRSGTTLQYCYYQGYAPGSHEFVIAQTSTLPTYERYTFPTKPYRHFSGTAISSDPGTFAAVTSVTISEGSMFRYSATDYSNIGPYGVIKKIPSSFLSISAGAVERKTLVLSDIERTDSRIVKIIKLPYCPIEVTYSNGIYIFPDNWKFENGLMRLEDDSLSTEFSNQFYSRSPSSVMAYTIPVSSRTVFAQPLIEAESKLYNSDFFTYKYAYDSFANEIRWENFEGVYWDLSNRPDINFTFKPTNTINSKFDFYADYEYYYEDTQDYEGHLLVNRNNEETVFSNDYINYIRTGYNYDKKAKEQSTTMSYLGAAVSLASGIASFAASGITGGVSAAAGISLVTAAITGFASAASTQASNERAMESKLAGLKAQATGVAGADDVDLMSYYSDNRMHIIQYRTENTQRLAIYRLFFYCGYAHNTIDVPDLTSRYWFNYIMCKPVFKEEGITPYLDYIDDVKARYQTGVTVYHHKKGIWDWDQQYENWETDIAETFAAPKFDSSFITGLTVSDEYGVNFTYSSNATTPLDGTNYYVEWIYAYNGDSYTGTSQGVNINPGTWWASGISDLPSQLEYAGAHIRCRIISTTSEYSSSDWVNVTYGG